MDAEIDNKQYINVLKYLNYQKINVSQGLLNEINLIDKMEKLEFMDISNEDLYSVNNKSISKNISIEQNSSIKNAIDLFKIPCQKKNINYLYYILILESLPNNIIRNFYRYFSSEWMKLYNLGEHNIKIKYYLKDINISSSPLILIIDCLTYLQSKNEKSVLFFINCLNHFFT